MEGNTGLVRAYAIVASPGDLFLRRAGSTFIAVIRVPTIHPSHPASRVALRVAYLVNVWGTAKTSSLAERAPQAKRLKEGWRAIIDKSKALHESDQTWKFVLPDEDLTLLPYLEDMTAGSGITEPLPDWMQTFLAESFLRIPTTGGSYKVPNFYLLYKVHKDVLGFRPITGNWCSPSQPASRLLAFLEGAVRAPHTSSCGGLSKRARLQHRFTGFRADPAGECVGWG
eukprot:COSAG03_NODE_34_length_17821_cov_18.833531_8_plen_227_part_00